MLDSLTGEHISLNNGTLRDAIKFLKPAMFEIPDDGNAASFEDWG